MTIDRNDPRWTAYVLDELGAEERTLFEDEMLRDPSSRDVLAEVRESVEMIQGGLSFEEPAVLTPAQRNEILANVPQAATGGGGHRFGRWSMAAGIAASLLIGIVTVRVVQEAPNSSGGGALISSLPEVETSDPDTVVVQTSAQAPGAMDLPVPAGDVEAGSPDTNAATSAASNERDAFGFYRQDDDLGVVADNRAGQREFRDQTVAQARVSADESAEPSTVTEELSSRALRFELAEAAGPGVAGEITTGQVIAESEIQALPETSQAFAQLVGREGVSSATNGVVGGALGNVAPAEAPASQSAVLDSLSVSTFAEVAASPPPPPPTTGALPDQRNRNNFSTEEYDRITDNPFHLVSQEPLSTFSVDVDTASYANVRRFLNQRTLPPADAVRIEEMINYFSYDYAPPRDGRPVRINAEVATAPWAPQHRLVRIGIQGQEIQRNERAASNLVFLLDVSGSMNEPDKLPLLVDGMKLLVDQLGENDRVAIVVYAGASGLVLDSTPGFRTERILSALERLRAGGSTNGGAGIQLAYDIAVRNFIDGGVNRVILATDGDFNVGVTNNGDLTRLIEQEARTGVFLSVLGFGTGNYNDAGLEALADRGNGNYAYIDSIREARKVLVEEIGSTLVTIAKDVKFQVEFNPSEVNAYRLIGYENRALENQDFNDDQVDAGEIGAGHTVTALFEIVPAGVELNVPGVDPLRYQTPLARTDAAESGELLTVKVRYKEPDGDTSLLIDAPVIDRGQEFDRASSDFRFASAVAGFGMILRDSPYRGSANYDSVLRIAEASRGSDEGEYRREFVELVRRARALDDLGR